jgi:hypothetical protein
MKRDGIAPMDVAVTTREPSMIGPMGTGSGLPAEEFRFAE